MALEPINYPENNPNWQQVRKTQTKNMLTVKNFNEIADNKREVPQGETDFGSTFRKHQQDFDKLYI